ncbi:HTH-type transcriptional regulator IscR [Streptomyces hirsutus]
MRAVRADTGEPLAVTVDPALPGVRVEEADTFGQRLAAGGSMEFDAVPVTVDDVLGSLSADEDVLSPLTALASPVSRLLSAQLRLGLAEGVLAEAREYSRSGQWPRHPAWPAEPPRDPQTLTAFGDLTVLTRSAAALTDQAVDALLTGLERGEGLAYDEYAEISVLRGDGGSRRVQGRAGVHVPRPRHHRRPLHVHTAGLRPVLAQRQGPHPVRAGLPPAARHRRLLPQRRVPAVRPAGLIVRGPAPDTGSGVRDTTDMRISARADYAVRAALQLAASRDDAPLKTEAIAGAQDIPHKFLEGILNDMRRGGLVLSQRGGNGGYRLARPAESISIADVIRVVDGPLVSVRGVRPPDLSYFWPAQSLLPLWIALRSNVREILEGVSLADVAAAELPADVAALTDVPDAWVNP